MWENQFQPQASLSRWISERVFQNTEIKKKGLCQMSDENDVLVGFSANDSLTQ